MEHLKTSKVDRLERKALKIAAVAPELVPESQKHHDGTSDTPKDG